MPLLLPLFLSTNGGGGGRTPREKRSRGVSLCSGHVINLAWVKANPDDHFEPDWQI